MLLHFLLALAAIVFLIFHDVSNEKSGFALKNHWVKYVSALVLGTFLVPYLLAWKYIQYAEISGLVIIFGFSFNTIASLLKEKGIIIPGANSDIKMGSGLIPKESSDHPNANGSRIFAIIILGLLLISAVVGFSQHFFKDGTYLTFAIINGVSSLVVAGVNIENTFETNDSWKTVVGCASCIFSFLLIGIPFANLNGG